MKQHRIKNWALITGFGSFPGVEKNPTEELIHDLSKHSSSQPVDIHAIVLDVSFERSAEKLMHHLQSNSVSPMFLLHFGVSRSPYLRIEKQAVNEKHVSIPDIDGIHCEGVAIDPKYALTKSISVPFTQTNSYSTYKKLVTLPKSPMMQVDTFVIVHTITLFGGHRANKALMAFQVFLYIYLHIILSSLKTIDNLFGSKNAP